MPPKRRGKKSGKPRTRKAPISKKTPEHDEHAVDWAVPKTKGRNIFDAKHIDSYAHTLYGRESTEVQPTQVALPEAQIRSPIYQRADGKDLQPGGPNHSSAALCGLYNEIKRISGTEPDGRHDIAALTQQFQDEDENSAVVLSRAENQEVLVLDRDRRFQVYVGLCSILLSFVNLN
jgi:hypothetical protein